MTLAWLEGDLTSIALCWRLDRRDGVAIGFTSHDRDLAIDGLVYRAAPGMTPSAVSVSDGFEVDTLDVSGALTSDAITAGDMAAGRWDGAAARLFAVDWRDPGGGSLHLTRGELGDVAIRDGAFSAELRGPTALLERLVVERTSPECRASLGDRRCRVDMAPRTRFARIVAVGDATTVTVDATEPEAGAYGYGRIDWIEGANSGMASLIAGSDGATIMLREPAPFAVEIGGLVRLREGCDRALATCRDRFANAINFRGEPYLPGNDLLTRYPGA
ncbi:DUF2163 domain-containing protein [Sphingomonas bacterium]|uniref:DUF2163 domain-containing protein n=1 Tax=Sphingomonas bacterium TaxID=1895847 RepID=UPI001575A6AA|nr:DUF2163 domain-containing protein [Sphingomonas bacterium]